MKKRGALIAIALLSLTLAGCGRGSEETDTEPDTMVDDTTVDDNDTDTEDMDAVEGEVEANAASDTEITDEDVKMIEDFLNEVINSVEGEGTQ